MRRFDLIKAHGPRVISGAEITQPFINAREKQGYIRHLNRGYGVSHKENIYLPNIFNPLTNPIDAKNNLTQLTGLTSTGLPVANGQPYIYRICVGPNSELYLLTPKHYSGSPANTGCNVLKYPTATTWTSIAAHPSSEWGWAWCTEDGRIYTAGTVVYMYKPSSNTWSSSLGATGLTFSTYLVNPNFSWKGKMYGFNGTNMYRFDPPNTFTNVSGTSLNNSVFSLNSLASIQIGELVFLFNFFLGSLAIFSLEKEKIIVSRLIGNNHYDTSYNGYVYIAPLLYHNETLYFGGHGRLDLRSLDISFGVHYPHLVYSPALMTGMTNAYGSQTHIIPGGYMFNQTAWVVSSTQSMYWYLWKASGNYSYV